MKVRSLLKGIRQDYGLSASELAARIGVTRQTIYAIEEGTFVPNTTVALKLANVLNRRVEELFNLESEDVESVEAEAFPALNLDFREGQPVKLCRVNERLIAAPIVPFPSFFSAGDGVVLGMRGRDVLVRPLDEWALNGKRLLIAGCDPALSLPAAEMSRAGFELVCIPASSRRALQALKRETVHAAGSHLLDSDTALYNVRSIHRLFPRGEMQIVTFASWEEGLVVQQNNPHNLHSIADLANSHIRLVNRERGSGSRTLLDKGLRKAGISGAAIAGYDNEADGHLSAAYAIATGLADCCIAPRSAARHFGLDFVPLQLERFDLSFPRAGRDLPGLKILLDILTGTKFRRQLQAIAGYDVTHTGEMVA